jgi:carbon-monoxide dehydrogenase medium subunit
VASPASIRSRLIVRQAVCVIAGPAGRRELPVEHFCVGPGRNALERGELLVSLKLPPPPLGFGRACVSSAHEMDIAVVGAAAAVVLDAARPLAGISVQQIVSARVALGAVAPTPLFVPEAGAFLAGRPATAENIAAAADIARAAARPISDMRGTAAQRKHLTAVLTRRALQGAIERASG